MVLWHCLDSQPWGIGITAYDLVILFLLGTQWEESDEEIEIEMNKEKEILRL